MMVVGFVLVMWITVYRLISQVDSAEIKNKPVCLQKWEDCLIEAVEPRRTPVECDKLMTERYGCPKPKPRNPGRKGDYDYVLTRDSVDTDKQLDVKKSRYGKTDQAKSKAEQNNGASKNQNASARKESPGNSEVRMDDNDDGGNRASKSSDKDFDFPIEDDGNSNYKIPGMRGVDGNNPNTRLPSDDKDNLFSPAIFDL